MMQETGTKLCGFRLVQQPGLMIAILTGSGWAQTDLSDLQKTVSVTFVMYCSSLLPTVVYYLFGMHPAALLCISSESCMS